MSTIKKLVLVFTLTILPVVSNAMDHKKKDILDTAIANGSFKTLLAAVKATGLVDTLKGKGTFTLFAPTDSAFSKLPKGTVTNLLKPENKAKPVPILTHRVLVGEKESKVVIGKKLSLKTVNGTSLSVDGTYGVMISGAKVVSADVKTSNGIIHVFDKVFFLNNFDKVLL